MANTIFGAQDQRLYRVLTAWWEAHDALWRGGAPRREYGQRRQCFIAALWDTHMESLRAVPDFGKVDAMHSEYREFAGFGLTASVGTSMRDRPGRVSDGDLDLHLGIALMGPRAMVPLDVELTFDLGIPRFEGGRGVGLGFTPAMHLYLGDPFFLETALAFRWYTRPGLMCRDCDFDFRGKAGLGLTLYQGKAGELQLRAFASYGWPEGLGGGVLFGSHFWFP